VRPDNDATKWPLLRAEEMALRCVDSLVAPEKIGFPPLTPVALPINATVLLPPAALKAIKNVCHVAPEPEAVNVAAIDPADPCTWDSEAEGKDELLVPNANPVPAAGVAVLNVLTVTP
jgi:hypothetical protein